MTSTSYAGVGQLGAFCRGHEIVCRFGYRYLICKPIDKPMDPLLNQPEIALSASSLFGEQFLISRHTWNNQTDILQRIYQYLNAEEFSSSQITEAEMITAIANAIERKQLLVILIDSD
ncbi:MULTISPECIES: hypothetical protein [unclassified Shewanella]|uniref:hypothetical protein n=1 Tax=unclassified Shewanella TaxID=196818 RepID=UPI000C86391B|nr:hypothetical protein [Shewanella sp. 10N.286.51.B7]PMG77126.1 hypothetical protein BCU84_01135 [Shewanella sp. 10N.286.51.B7]